MATPLADLLRAVRSDPATRAAAEHSPAELLTDHGWPLLDAADLREAFLILADGAPTGEAGEWLTAGESIDTAAESHEALAAALTMLPVATIADDPEIDDPGIDDRDIDDRDIDDRDIDDRDIADAADADDTDGAFDTGDAGTGEEAVWLDELLVSPDPLAPFAEPDRPLSADDRGPGEIGDGWDDLI